MRLPLRLCLVVCAALFAAAPAHAAFKLAGIDGISSTVMQQGQSSFSGLGLRTRITSDRLISGFSIMPTVEWWRSSTTVQPFGIKSARNDGTMGARPEP
jgi:hypothetical protein